MKLRRVKKLMENESWRLYMLSRLNQSTQREDNTEYVEAVEISPKAYRGIGDLFRAIESGIETNFKERKGHGGLASGIGINYYINLFRKINLYSKPYFK